MNTIQSCSLQMLALPALLTLAGPVLAGGKAERPNIVIVPSYDQG